MNLLALLAIIIALGIITALGVRAIGGNIAVVDDWKKAWLYYSSWGMAFVAMLPDLWNAAISGGYLDQADVPGAFSWAIKAGLLLTFLIKQIRQVKPPAIPFDKEP